MLLSNIELKPNRILVHPTAEDTSSFSTEKKKYERSAVAVVKSVSNYIAKINPGDKVIYDDTKSIDFVLDGVALSIITADDIVAFIREEA